MKIIERAVCPKRLSFPRVVSGNPLDPRLKHSGMTIVLIILLLFSAPTLASTASKQPPPLSISASNDIVEGLSDLEQNTAGLNDDERDFIIGYSNYRHGNWKEARDLLCNEDNKLDIVKDHLLFFCAAIENRLENSEVSLKLLGKLAANYPDSVWGSAASVEKAKALIALKRFGEARKILSDKTWDAELLIAKSYMEEESDAAIGYLKTLAIHAAGEAELSELSGLFADAKKRFHVDLKEWLDEPANQMRLAQNFVAHSQWSEAAARLEKILKLKNLDADLKTETKWLLARCLRWTHHYDAAISLMEELLKDPNSRGFRSTLLSTLTTTYTKKNDYAKAISIRKQMLDDALPRSGTAAQMAFKIAFLYMDEGKYDEAIDLWRKALGIRNGKNGHGSTEWYLAWCYYMAGKYNEAISIFNGMIAKGGPKSNIHDRLTYWKARSLLKLGKTDEAKVIFKNVMGKHPNGYYAELAQRRLEDIKCEIGDFATLGCRGKTKEVSLRAPAKQSLGSKGVGNLQGHFGRAIFFDMLGLHEEAAKELRATGISSFEAISELASRNFAHDLTYRIAETRYRNIVKDGSPATSGQARTIWEGAYPRAYAPLITKITEGSDVDPFFVWSIMRNESSFRPGIVSSAGAVGLMQLMPTTAGRLMQSEGLGAADRRELYNPAPNIMLGVSYLKLLSGLFPKNPVAWIASYNAGEEAVSRWIKNGKLNDIEEWIEEIPYDETNLYVKKVLLSYWRYQKLY